MANLKCCVVCNSRNLAFSNRVVTVVDEVEVIIFERKSVCNLC